MIGITPTELRTRTAVKKRPLYIWGATTKAAAVRTVLDFARANGCVTHYDVTSILRVTKTPAVRMIARMGASGLLVLEQRGSGRAKSRYAERASHED